MTVTGTRKKSKQGSHQPLHGVNADQASGRHDMEVSLTKTKPSGRLLMSTPLDAKDELESELDRCAKILQALTNGCSEKEAYDALTKRSGQDTQGHKEVCLGLLYLILTEPNQAQRSFRDLTMATRDDMNVIVEKVKDILRGKFPKLQDVPRIQLLWLVKELVKKNVQKMDEVLMYLMKLIVGGNISDKNLELTENVLDILIEHKDWLIKSPLLVATSVYTFLRLIADHGTQILLPLRQKEVELCICLLRDRDRFMDWSRIGRDLVRLLQSVANIPEMELLWRDLQNNPTSLSPPAVPFNGILDLLTVKTPKRFLACRLTPDMEEKIQFMTNDVYFGRHTRYQKWFRNQYLSTAESHTLCCDLIRYICGVIHPSNKIMNSGILPRWAIIGWLLTNCKNGVEAAELALFYDWLFFNPANDSIMNIEPAIFVMHHSMKHQPNITNTLLDFMCKLIPHFFPPLESEVRQGMSNALKEIMDKGVLPQIAPLFGNPNLDTELRSLLRKRFPDFCSSPPPTEQKVEDKREDKGEEKKEYDMEVDNELDTEAAITDNEFKDKQVISFPQVPVAITEESADITPFLDQLSNTISEQVVQLQKASDPQIQGMHVQKIVDLILEADFDTDQMATLASCLAILFKSDFGGVVLPDDINEQSLEEYVRKPQCLLFKSLCATTEDNAGFSVLLDMLIELYQKENNLGYHLLYYLKASKSEVKKTYELFAHATALGDLHTCLMMDVKACQENDVRLLCYLIPTIYSEFPEQTLHSVELLNMIVAVMDPNQLHELMCQAVTGNLVMFGMDFVLNTLKKSLEWETFEQYSTWQLFLAHSIPLEAILPILSYLNHKEHPEALSCLLLQLCKEEPTEDMVRMVLSRPWHPEDLFSNSVLRHWLSQHEALLSEHITALIKNNILPRKRQMNRISGNKQAQLTLELILEHLDTLRLSLTNTKQDFFSEMPVLQALQSAQANCQESQSVRFKDLFSLVEECEGSQSKPSKRRRNLVMRSSSISSPPSDEESEPIAAKKKRTDMPVLY